MLIEYHFRNKLIGCVWHPALLTEAVWQEDKDILKGWEVVAGAWERSHADRMLVGRFPEALVPLPWTRLGARELRVYPSQPWLLSQETQEAQRQRE